MIYLGKTKLLKSKSELIKAFNKGLLSKLELIYELEQLRVPKFFIATRQEDNSLVFEQEGYVEGKDNLIIIQQVTKDSLNSL